MKIAILNDTHAGVRGDMVAMADYQGRFYNEVFFPYLKENGITHILHLGDYFDRRKYVNFSTLKSNREHFIKPMLEHGISMDLMELPKLLIHKKLSILLVQETPFSLV